MKVIGMFVRNPDVIDFVVILGLDGNRGVWVPLDRVARNAPAPLRSRLCSGIAITSVIAERYLGT